MMLLHFLLTTTYILLWQHSGCDAAIREAEAQSRKFSELILRTKPPLSPVGRWRFLPGDYNNDGTLDMFCILTNGAVGTEVHVLNGKDSYTTFLLQKPTPLPHTDDNFVFTLGDYNKDGKLDVWMIKKNATSTEIHILDGSQFDRYLLNTGTVLHPTGKNWDFHAGDWNNDGTLDLIGVNRGSHTGTEVHVLNGITSFQSFNLKSTTAFGLATGPFTTVVADYNRDGKLDIYVIKCVGVWSTEIHILNGKNLKQYLLHTGTILHKTQTPEWAFAVADYNGNGQPDIIAINTQEISILILRPDSQPLLWGDRFMWTGQELPGPDDLVVIPIGKHVVLDINATIDGIEIRGMLSVRDGTNLSLTSRWILVDNGQLAVGSEAYPHQNDFAINFRNHQSNTTVSTVPLRVQGNNGRLKLHKKRQ